MAVTERDIVLQSNNDGKLTIDLPVTALKNVNDNAIVKEVPEDTDYIPVVDTGDNGCMKKVLWSAVKSSLSGAGGADTAKKLENAVNVQTDLGSSAAASFDGSADITVGVTGVLSAANGGLGNDAGYIRTVNIKEGSVVGESASVQGKDCEASGKYSYAEGYQTTATKNGSHAEGSGTTSSGLYSHAEGQRTTASGAESHAEGVYTTASASYSHAGGRYTVANTMSNTVIGMFNSYNSKASPTTPDDLFVVGNGSGDIARSNAFRVNKSASVYGGTYSSTGADYAEFFEWSDGNPDNEDRRGLFVTLCYDKIRIANSGDDFILGVVSGDPSVVGDAYDDQWNGMYIKDIFGSAIFEDVEIPEQKDEDGNILEEYHMENRLKLNPDYNSSEKYVPRSKRKEWNAVGMVGKLVVLDDGTCLENEYCKPDDNGKASYSEIKTRCRVMKRLDKNHVRILIL